ncbi:UDP-N-acetylglucosamine 1-carboxyvinyltransferase [soil metagenome]
MDKLVIQGGSRLRGSIHVGGSKNTALPLMAAALLADGETVIRNMPVLQDVDTFSNVLRVTGSKVTWDPDEDPTTPDSMHIDASRLAHFEAPYELVKKMRASFYMLGALLARGGYAKVSLPGGCAWGPRPVDLHLKGIEALGASIEMDRGYVIARAPRGGLKGGRFRFEPSSVGATINVMLAAVTASGQSVLENAAAEPDVVVFGEMLKAMGAQIEGLGTPTITIDGVDSLNPVDFDNCPDRIELGTYMIAAAMAGEPGETFTITGAQPDHLGDAFMQAFEATGAGIDYVRTAECGPAHITITTPERVRAVSITTAPYPGFPTDLQAQWSVMMSQAADNSEVVDTVYTDRFKHIPELRRMGANCFVIGNKVVVEGGSKLEGTHVMSTDLRASVSLVLAGMVAEGETHVQRVYHLDRGYERLEGKLAGAGINIHREQYDEFAGSGDDD